MIGSIALALTLQTAVEITATDRIVEVGGLKFEDFIAQPLKPKRGAKTVLIVHDWNGLDSHEKNYAKRLAEQGYIAIAVDVYGQGVRPTSQKDCSAEAGKLYQAPKTLHARLAARLVDPKAKYFALGFCFGGTSVLEMARQNMKVQGVASFHGGLKPLMPQVGSRKPAVLTLHGEDDPFVPKADVAAFHASMALSKAKFEFVAYPGAVHSFTIKSDAPKSSGAAYDANADTESWKKLLEWLKTTK